MGTRKDCPAQQGIETRKMLAKIRADAKETSQGLPRSTGD